MGDPIDARLMAHADGRLGPADAAEVEALLAADPHLRRIHAAYLATRPAAMQAAYADILTAPVPERLIATVKGNAAATSAERVLSTSAERDRPSAEIIPMRPRAKSKTGGERVRPWVMAASIAAILAATGLARLIGGTVVSSDTVVALGSDKLFTERAVSPLIDRLAAWSTGDVVGVTGVKWSIQPTRTFAGADGRFCRELNVAGGTDRAAVGVACRRADGRWGFEALADAGSSPAATPGATAPAAGTSDDAVAAAVKRLGGGPALKPADEARVIANGWNKDAR